MSKQLTYWTLEEWVNFAIWALQSKNTIAHCRQVGTMCWLEEQSGGKVSIWSASFLISNLHPSWMPNQRG